jgi:hypothetical protein
LRFRNKEAQTMRNQFSLALVALALSACASAPTTTTAYTGNTVTHGTPEACGAAMEAAQVWLVRFGPENAVTHVQTATQVVVQTARPTSDTGAEVFVDVTRSNRPDGSCLISVEANSWNPFSVNRAVRVEGALAQHLRTAAGS